MPSLSWKSPLCLLWAGCNTLWLGGFWPCASQEGFAARELLRQAFNKHQRVSIWMVSLSTRKTFERATSLSLSYKLIPSMRSGGSGWRSRVCAVLGNVLTGKSMLGALCLPGRTWPNERPSIHPTHLPLLYERAYEW